MSNFNDTLEDILNKAAMPGYKVKVLRMMSMDAIEIRIIYLLNKAYQVVHYPSEYLHSFSNNILFENILNDLSLKTSCFKAKYWNLFDKHMKQILNTEVKQGSLWA